MPSDYESGGGHRTSRARSQASDYDRTSSQIPIWGWLDGSQGRMQGDEDRLEADKNRRYWDDLNAPTADQLTADYDYDTEGADAEREALSQMQQWARGGLTGTDHRMMDQTRERAAQTSRGQREALAAQAQARGMGGGGLDFALQQDASQQGQQQASDIEAQMMQGAQQRQLQASTGAAAVGSSMRGEMQHETERQADADVAGVQGSFDAATTRASGATGQYAGDQGARQSERDRDQQRQSSLATTIAGLFG